MKFRLYLLVTLSLILSSCANLKKVDKVNSYDVEYTNISNNKKNIKFVGMTEIGQPQFFENVKKVIEDNKKEGYVVFYENTEHENMPDSSLRKLRKLFGAVPSKNIKEKQYRLLLDKGYKLRNDSVYLSSLDVFADKTGDELIAEYEKTYGKILLSEKEKQIPLTRRLPITMLLPKANNVTINYRNKHLAKLINESKFDKIIVLYDAKFLNGFIEELNKIDKSYIKNETKSTENNPAFLQVVSGDSLRRSTKDYIIEDGYIDQINQFMNVRLTAKNYYEFFSLNSNNQSFDIRTNSNTSLKLSGDYKSISVWYTFTPKDLGLNTQEVEKGNTGGFNFGFGVIKRNWFNQFNFRYIEGFYLENTKDFLPTWKTGDAYIQKPQMAYAALEGTTGYKFNPKYSLRSISSQTERQLKSTGSLVASVNYRFYQLKDEVSPLFDSILRSDNYEIGFNLGYFYNLVFLKNFYLSIGTSPGLGVIHSKVEQKNILLGVDETSHNSAVFRLSGHLGIGYNGERFYSGIYADFSGGSFMKKNIPVINTDFRNLYQAFVGYRFEVNKSIRANRMY